MPWDWLVLDVAYVLVLLGGSLVLRARAASPAVWVCFGVLSVAVGGFLFAGTHSAQSGFVEATRSMGAATYLAASC